MLTMLRRAYESAWRYVPDLLWQRDAMSYRCLNQGCFSRGSDDAGPPEYSSSNPFTCTRCYEEYDLDADDHSEDDEGYVCDACRYRCERCGEPCGDMDSVDYQLVNGDKVCDGCIEEN